MEESHAVRQSLEDDLYVAIGDLRERIREMDEKTRPKCSCCEWWAEEVALLLKAAEAYFQSLI